jgi:predicted small metal-binding protein
MPTKVLRCSDIMPGCDTVIEGKTADEVFAKAEDHARKEHNMTIILPSTMTQIEAAIRDKP